MIALICLLIPPFILMDRREKLFQNHESIYKSIYSYAAAVLLLNGFMLAVLYFLFDNNGNLFVNLNQYNGFSCKYIAVTLVLALTEPYAEKFLKENFNFAIAPPQKNTVFSR